MTFRWKDTQVVIDIDIELQEEYRAITTRIEIEDNSSEELSIRYSSDCNKKQNKRRKKCSNIPLGTPVEFTLASVFFARSARSPSIDRYKKQKRGLGCENFPGSIPS